MKRRRLLRYGTLVALASTAGCGDDSDDTTSDEPNTDPVELRNEGTAPRRFDVTVSLDGESLFSVSETVPPDGELAFRDAYTGGSIGGGRLFRVEAVLDRSERVTAVADLGEFTPTGVDVVYRTRLDPNALALEIRGPFEFGSSESIRAVKPLEPVFEATRTAALTAVDSVAGDGFGGVVELAGDTVLVGGRDGEGTARPVAVFHPVDAEWTRTTALRSESGRSGTATALAGDTALVGGAAIAEDDPQAAALAFVRDGRTWQRTATLTPTGERDGAASVGAVDLHGETAVVTVAGAESRDGTGTARVFRRTDTGWTDAIALTPGTNSDEALFGRSAAIGAEYLAVGAVPPASAAGTTRGEVDVFSRGDDWTLQSRLRPGEGPQRAGTAIDLVDRTLIVGAPGFDDGTGLAYAFRRTDAGWEQAATLRPIRCPPDNRAGSNVAVTPVGTGLLAAVAGRETVSVFHRNADDDWRVREELGPNELWTTGDRPVNVALDGRRLLVGVPRVTGESQAAAADVGAALLFKL